MAKKPYKKLDVTGVNDAEEVKHPHENDVMTWHPYCPSCGQRTILGTSPEWLLTHFEGELMHAMLLALIRGRMEDRTVSLSEICREMDKVPLVAEDSQKTSLPNAAMQLIHGSRTKLVKLGWVIMGPGSTGKGYALVPFSRVADYDKFRPDTHVRS